MVRLTGAIGQGGRFRGLLNHEAVARQIDQAFKPSGLKAVALVVNSPGGSPVQSALIHEHIRRLADEKSVPVLAFAEDVAASGGYLILLAGDELYAHDASLIGSIGVVSGGFGFPEALARLGVERRVYTQGENKVRLDPFLPEKPEDKAWLSGIQEQVHGYFKDLVRRRRQGHLPEDAAGLFSGDVWVGEGARRLGLIDGLGTAEAVLKQKFGQKVRIRPIEKRRGVLASMTGAQDSRGGPEQWLAALDAQALWRRWGL